MRLVFVGASALAVATARILIKRNHEVVIIEHDRDVVDSLAEDLDCGLIHGDGTKPAILREAAPKDSDVLLALTDDDQDNILAALVGRSLGFPRVVPKIEDPGFEHICVELGLTDTIIPDQTMARTLSDMLEGEDIPGLTTIVKGDVRFYSFIARKEDEGTIAELDLPSGSKAICIYRDDDFIFPEEETKIVDHDQVVLITNRKNLPDLRERWEEEQPNKARAAPGKRQAGTD